MKANILALPASQLRRRRALVRQLVERFLAQEQDIPAGRATVVHFPRGAEIIPFPRERPVA